MTRPSVSSLVLDGSEIKLRLEAERARTNSPVHVDWVRFTVLRRKAPIHANLSPDRSAVRWDSIWDDVERQSRMAALLLALPDCDFDASAQALELARDVAQCLGDDFTVATEVRKGHDFYRFRWSIERNSCEVGWVGFLASGDSPRQQAQAQTLHCNLFGAACTFGSAGWSDRIADLIDARDGDVTRCDLALDFFDGFSGGLDRVMADYKSGLCDAGGRRLKSNCVGDWANGHERSFYFGSKEAGKQTNVYEKGDQLFGVEAASPWLRIELRYGNKLRVLSPDMLRRPADFFAGASEWHALMLAEADAIAAPEPVKCTGRLALQTVEAEVTRSLRWVKNVAAPMYSFLHEHLDLDDLLSLIPQGKSPKRLQRFSRAQISHAVASATNRFFTVEGASPAFA